MKSGLRVKLSFINGTRGVISLLLCLVMCPFLTIALVLTESSRYQQAVETLNEVNNSAAMSTLGNTDEYLKERFGLFATSQEDSVDATFQKYLQSNWGVLGDGATLNTGSVDFESSLSLLSQETLKQQILDYSELTVASELVVDALDLAELMEAIKGLGNIDAIMRTLNSVTKAAEVATATAEFVENVDKVLTALADYTTKYSAYTSARDAYITAAKDLRDTIKTEMDADSNLAYPSDITPTPTPSSTTPTPTPAEQKKSVYENDNVKAKMTTLDQKADALEVAADALADNVETIKTSLEAVVGNLDTVRTKIQELQDLSEPVASDSSNPTNSAASTAAIYDEIVTELMVVLEDFVSEPALTGMETSVRLLREQAKEIRDSYSATSITGETTDAEINALYPLVAVGVPEYTELDTAIKEAMGIMGGEDDSQSLTTMLENMVNTIAALFKIDGIYDGTLDANIKTTYFQALPVDPDGEPVPQSPYQLVLDSIKKMIDAADLFREAIGGLNLLKAIEAVVTAIEAIATYFGAIISWVESICIRVTELVTGGPVFQYEQLLISGYCTYIIPNRTDCEDGTALTGFEYGTLANADSSSDSTPIGGLNALIDFLSNLSEDTSEDITFCGAELEYILIGTQSEIVNQACAFTYLYLLRMLINIVPVFTSIEVTDMAAAANVAAPVIYALVLIIEPLLDCVILVNGGDSYLIKRYVYMTPTGVVKLIEDFGDILSDELQAVIAASKGPKEPNTSTMQDFFKDSLLAVNYRDHQICMLLLLPERTVLTRTQHIIQMESESYYKEQVADFTFDISKSYAYLYFNVDVTLNPLFEIGNLSKTGYPYKKSYYRGY
jgi:hypothetical protein